MLQFSSVKSLSCVLLFVTPWTAACQASLSITNAQSLLKLISIKSVMPSNHLILCHPLLFLTAIFPSIRVFYNESVLHFRWPEYYNIRAAAWASILPMNIQGWFLLGWTGLITLQSKRFKSFLQHHSSKASILRHSAFFMVQILHSYMTTGKTLALTRWNFAGKVMYLLFNICLGWSKLSLHGASIF